MAGLLVKIVTGVTGLAAEAYEHNKAKKAKERSSAGTAENELGLAPSLSAASATSASTAPPSYDVAVAGRSPARSFSNDKKESLVADTNQDLDNPELEALYERQDEITWQLDEAQNNSPTTPPSEKAQLLDENDMDGLIRAFMARHPQPMLAESMLQPLTCPVILPQKRPGSRARGFVRAYSPVLEDAGLDQAAFLDFLDTFSKATRHSPVFDAINLACFVGGFIPEPFTQIITTAVGAATMIASKVDDRRKTTNFMQAMNESLFKPRGLFCLIMTYKPSSDAMVTRFDFSSPSPFDISQVIGKAAAAPTGVKKYLNLKVSQGTTHEFELPDAAPLVFPEIDNASEAQKGTMKRSARFVADYIDRKRQADWIAKNPDSKLNALPGPQFESKLGDPNHPIHSGSIVALVTGGLLAKTPKREKRAERDEQGYERRVKKMERKMERTEDKQERRARKHGGYDALGTPRDSSSRSNPSAPHGRSASASSSSSSNDDYNKIPTNALQLASSSTSQPSSSSQRALPSRPRRQAQRRDGGPVGLVKKMIKEDTLYLMVVNMPSQEEIDAAMAKAKLQKNVALQRGLEMLGQRFGATRLG